MKMNSNTVLYELKHNLFQPYTSSQYTACILAHNKNEPMSIDTITEKIRNLGWTSTSLNYRYSVYSTLCGKFLGKQSNKIFVELENKKFKLTDEFYKTCGEALSKYFTTKFNSAKTPESTTLLAKTEKTVEELLDNSTKVIAQPVQQLQPTKNIYEQAEIQKQAQTALLNKAAQVSQEIKQELKQEVKKPVAQNWNVLSERNDIDKLTRLGVPKEIIGFLYSSIRTESITHFLTSKNEEQVTNSFVAFVHALNDMRIVNWLFNHKEFPLNNNQNKYEQVLQMLIRNAKEQLVEYQANQQKIAALKMFNEMLKQNNDFKTLREGEEVRLVVMGDTKIIPFGKAIYRSGEVFLKYES